MTLIAVAERRFKATDIDFSGFANEAFQVCRIEKSRRWPHVESRERQPEEASRAEHAKAKQLAASDYPDWCLPAKRNGTWRRRDRHRHAL
jgi:hypothetical protein